MSTLSVLIDFVVLGIFLYIFKAYFAKLKSSSSNPTGLPYPPGPKPLPLVGNLFDVPKGESWKTYKAWSQQYGELVHFTVFGQHFLVVNSIRVAIDLLEKRSKKYSDRPNIPMINLMGWDWNIAFIPYGDAWRQRRREFHQEFRSDKTVQRHAIIMKKVYQFVNKLLIRPDDFGDHIRHYPGSISMSIAYGYEIASHNDHFVNMAEQSVEMLSGSTFPGAAAVNALPILQYLPDWLPGMGFKHYARRCKKITTEMKNAPFQFAKDQMQSGFPTTCVATELISRLSDPHDKMSIEIEEAIKDVCAIAYAAGADTTGSAIQTGFLAMVLHPEVRRKAQSEIDAVIGNARLPSFDDRKLLPYVNAFVWEVLRWHPVTPLSVARAVYENDIYEDSFIPKGATLLVNTWGIHYDEETYPEPNIFKPERFLEADGTLSDKYPIAVFGTGRRMCPGRHVADATIWAAMALILAVFDVEKVKDKDGNDIDVPEVYNDGLISHPQPFLCSVTPRSEQAKSLIREICSYVQN